MKKHSIANGVIGTVCGIWVTLFLVIHKTDTLDVEIHEIHGYSLEDVRKSLENEQSRDLGERAK